VFWLYPSQQLPFDLELEQYYQPEYLATARDSLTRYAKHPIQITAWGRCEKHWHINPAQKRLLPKIAKSTIWNFSALEQIFEQYQVLKLLIVRVYRLSSPCSVNVPPSPTLFYSPQPEDVMTGGSESDTPVVSEASFNRRKDLLLAGKVYPHTDLEALQFQVEQILSDKPVVKQLNHDIKQFLGWTSDVPIKQPDPDVAWINDIVALGDRSIEQDTGKSNYQAGTDFEKIARRSLEFLRFKVEDAYEGGAGGLDWFCSKPYPIVGECKAGKLIPSGTVEELIKLGGKHLGADQFLNSAKLIVGPGKLGRDVPQAARNWRISIINAMTLQKLVELESKYPGSVNLMELKRYLEPGQIDNRIGEYIETVQKELKLREQIVKAVNQLKEEQNREQVTAIEVCILYNSRLRQDSGYSTLADELVHDLLIELSSPLTGYVGRIKGSDWRSDRFYFLRDLQVE